MLFISGFWLADQSVKDCFCLLFLDTVSKKLKSEVFCSIIKILAENRKKSNKNNMSQNERVKIVADDEASDIARQVFQNFIDKKGGVPSWARVMAHRPEILEIFSQLLSVTMGPGLVEQDNKWKCAYAVSHINKCQYCIGVVEGMLGKLGVDPENIEKIVTGEKANLKPDEQIAVRYAEAVTKDAVGVAPEIFEELKEHYNEAQIVELTSAIGLFNYINRFNDALGVLPE